jgi:mRNA interferase RelE/StbE
VTYTVIVTATARRDLGSMPARIVPAVVEFVFGDLAANPRRVGKPLSRELTGRYSARRGTYRVIYSIDDAGATVQVLRVGHRSDVYRPR